MTLVQLKYVITVSGQNSLNDAAKVLFVSQPSLSSAIRSLEKEIGFDIFIRSKNGITLTAKGAEFIGYAKSVMEQYELQFQPLLECGVYVYMWRGHPLADSDEIVLEELDEYPCLGFAQGEHNSFYFAEEVLSTYQYKRFIRANDRATLLNLMVGLNAYTLCSGIICEDLNGEEYCAVKLKSDERMTIGYIARKDAPISEIGQKYLEEIAKYKDKSLA